MSKWNSKLPTIIAMKGKYSTEDIAGAIGTTVNNLYKICHRNEIHLPREAGTYNGGRPKKDKSSKAAIEINEMAEILRSIGYIVVKKDTVRLRA